SAAATTIDVIESDNLLDNATKVGAFLKNQLQQKLGADGKVVSIRGKGMMLAVELDHAYPDLALTFLQHALVVNITGGGKIIRLLPAITMSESEARAVAEIIQDVIASLKKSK
nr:aminotransferase class III-fold pyridoxal phosphate-dependent enzyme [Acidiferrobacterales bacterium]